MMSENRTSEVVRAELQMVEGRLRTFELLVAALEDDQLLLSFSVTADRLAGAISGLRAMAESDRRAEQAAGEAAEMLYLLQNLMPDFTEKRRGLSFVLRRGLIPALRNRRYALKQGLAALEPSPGPEPTDLLERVARIARLDLLFRRTA